MAGKRTYGDPCGIARALDVVGERWALLVVRELLLGPKRFTDLRAGLPHLSPDVLSQRLRELEQAGVVAKGKLPPPASARVYELTNRGRELEPVLLALGRWGSRVPLASDSGELGVDALMVAMQTMYDPARADGLIGSSIELRVGEHRFTAHPTATRLDVTREPAAEESLATIAADSGTLQRVLWHGEPVGNAIRSNRLTVSGDRQAAERFLTLFPLTMPA
jgi:DNA-binding HxlR family transcriptional regulator